MTKNTLFKLLLVIQTIGLLVYTFIVFNAEGADLFSVFFANVLSLSWSGQFNLDFLCYLTLSGLWIMWRDNFSGKSIFLGLAAVVLGIVFFAPYLLWLLFTQKGDLKAMLLGKKMVAK